jgi:hypothetical protein
VLDILTMKCIDECLNDDGSTGVTFELITGAKYCRPSLKYYVDTTSGKDREYGSIEYPFKYIMQPFYELFNFYEVTLA